MTSLRKKLSGSSDPIKRGKRSEQVPMSYEWGSIDGNRREERYEDWTFSLILWVTEMRHGDSKNTQIEPM